MANAKLKSPLLAQSEKATTPAIDMAAMAQMLATMQAQMAALTTKPVAEAKATVTAKPKAAAKATTTAKPKAAFDGEAVFKALAGLDGVGATVDVTSTGRARVTAFCNDGSIVTVMLAK